MSARKRVMTLRMIGEGFIRGFSIGSFPIAPSRRAGRFTVTTGVGNKKSSQTEHTSCTGTIRLHEVQEL